MASVTNRPNGDRWVTFKAPNGKRQTIRLGKATASQADDFKQQVELLQVCHRLGSAPQAKTIEWLTLLSDDLHDKLSNCGLIERRGARTVAELVAWHAGRRPRKGSTQRLVNNAHASIQKYLGPQRKLHSIKPDDIAKFRAWLETDGKKKGGPMMPTTVSGICRRCRGMFQAAVTEGWIPNNPFRLERDWTNTNPDRDVYIPRIDFEAVLEEATDDLTRLIFSLARYAGLRSPSEVFPLEWSWVNWEHNTLFVKAPKTERYETHESRIVPLAEEVLRYLRPLFDRAVEGETHIVGGLAITRTAIANRLEAACRRANIVMWPKPFVNLRASCEHDWLEEHPINVVAAWMGHSPETMLKHYNRVAKEQSARLGGERASRPKTALRSEAQSEAPKVFAAD